MAFSEEQVQIITNLLSAAIGAGGSLGVQWLSKKKTKEESADDHTETIIKASADTVRATQDVIVMLQGMLDEQREQLTEKIERSNASFTEEIEKLNEQLKVITAENKMLTKKIQTLDDENKGLKDDVKHLSTNNKTLSDTVRGLKARLSKYEKTTNGN